MIKLKEIRDYTIEARVGVCYPLLVKDKQDRTSAYSLNYAESSYYLVDLSFSGRKEKGNFLKVDDIIYLTYEEPNFYT